LDSIDGGLCELLLVLVWVRPLLSSLG